VLRRPDSIWEDSNANAWAHNSQGIKNILEAPRPGRLTTLTASETKTGGLNPGPTVIFSGPRGLHNSYRPAFCRGIASRLRSRSCDVAYRWTSRWKHLCSYIPKFRIRERRSGARIFARCLPPPQGCNKCRQVKWRGGNRIRFAFQVEAVCRIFAINSGPASGRWDYRAS